MKISWKQFTKTHRPTTAPRFVQPDAHYTPGRELNTVCMLALASNAKRAVEIGTAHGHTAVALARTLPEAEILTIGTTRELAGHNSSKFDREIQTEERQGYYIREQPAEIRDRIRSIKMKPEPRESLASRVPLGSFQFAFIDGDHRWEWVAEDTKAILRAIDDGGLIVWDDYNMHNEVRAFINIVNARTTGPLVEIETTRVVFVKLTAEKRAELLEAVEQL